MHQSLVSANMFICEKILAEKEGILSAIRMVDAFAFKRKPDTPIEQQQVEMQVLAVIRMKAGDSIEHSLQLYLIRPDGTKDKVADNQGVRAESISPEHGFPGGVNLLANVAVIPSQVGTHYWQVMLDGEQVAITPFSLIEKKSQVVEQE